MTQPASRLFYAALGVSAALALTAGARAQSFNLDISDLRGVPSSTFGGAANQPGFWNLLDGSGAGSLRTLDGSTTNASISICCSQGALHGSFSPDISGNLSALMQDAKSLGVENSGSVSVSLRNLLPGIYEVYTYAWYQNGAAPGETEVFGYHSTEQSQTTGGAWPGQLVEGVTHTKHRMTTVIVPVSTDSQLYLSIDEAEGSRFLAGLQVKFIGPPGDAYCAATPNSTGQPAALTATGSISVLHPGLVLHAAPVPNQFGLFFYGPAQTQLPFADGFLCVAPGAVGLARLPATLATSGTLSSPLDVDNPPIPAAQITALSSWNFQAWFRDPAAGGSGANLSNGITLTFLP